MLLALFFVAQLHGQRTICEHSSQMDRICYEMVSDTHFTYQMEGPTGAEVGAGRYEDDGESITFWFDQMATPRVRERMSARFEGEVVIYVTQMVGQAAMPGCWVTYQGKLYESDEEGRFRLPYDGGTIYLFRELGGKGIALQPDKDKANMYNVEWFGPETTVVPAGRTIRILKEGFAYRVVADNSPKGSQASGHSRYCFEQ